MSGLIALSVSIEQPLPNAGQLFTTDLNPWIAGMSWSTGRPGGFLALSVSLKTIFPIQRNPKMARSREIEFQFFAHVRVMAGHAVVWEGRIEEFERVGGGMVGFTAVGYGTETVMSDNWYAASAAGPGTGTAAGLLRDVLRVCSPIVRPDEDNWADSGVVHSAADANNRYPIEVIQQLQNEGGGPIAAPWDFCVWQGQLATWLPRIPPKQADYQISDGPGVTWKENGSKLYSSIAVQYTIAQFGPASLTIPANTIDPTLAFGIVRSTILKAGTMTAAQAAAYQETQRLLLSRPETAISISCSDSEELAMPGGSGQPPWLVRADEWITIAGEGPFPIIHTDYTAASGGQEGHVEIQVGFYPRDYLRLVYDLQRYAQNQEWRTSPVSGAPF